MSVGESPVVRASRRRGRERMTAAVVRDPCIESRAGRGPFPNGRSTARPDGMLRCRTWRLVFATYVTGPVR
jgi:hypothetical protein